MDAAGVERNSCILAVRVLADVLAYCGVPAKPRAVRAAACCDAEQVAYVIDGSTGGDWPWHLVLLADGELLMDPTSDQMARAGLPVGLVCARVGDPEAAAWPFVDDATGVVVQYEPVPDQSWRQTPAWQPDWFSRRLVADVIRDLRGGFACPRCGMRSASPHDWQDGYCGACHAVTRPVTARCG